MVTVRSDRYRLQCQGEQLVDLVDLVVRDARQGVGEPGVGIDAVELGGLDQGAGNCGGLSAGLGTDGR